MPGRTPSALTSSPLGIFSSRKGDSRGAKRRQDASTRYHGNLDLYALSRTISRLFKKLGVRHKSPRSGRKIAAHRARSRGKMSSFTQRREGAKTAKNNGFVCFLCASASLRLSVKCFCSAQDFFTASPAVGESARPRRARAPRRGERNYA